MTAYTAADLTAARALGAAAFAQGIMCAPRLDAAVMAMILPGLPIGASFPLLEAWGSGWTAANIAAPWWTCEQCGVLGHDDGTCCAAAAEARAR